MDEAPRKARRGGARKGSGPKPQEIRAKRLLLLEKRFPDAEKALAYVISVVNNTREPTSMRLAAAQIVMDQVWGKPKQQVEVEQTGHITVVMPDSTWTPN